MKILCIGRNYRDHAAELNNPVPEQPVFFLKPETAQLRPGFPFFHPEFTQEIHHELELVVRICRNGRGFEPQFAHRYYDKMTLGIDFTARDIQAQCKAKGLPWEMAKSFDHSAPCSKEFFDINAFNKDIQELDFELLVNGERRQKGNTRDMIFSVDYLVSYLSKFITLKKGDLIFTGTPSGVSKVNVGDTLEGILEGKKVLEVKVK